MNLLSQELNQNSDITKYKQFGKQTQLTPNMDYLSTRFTGDTLNIAKQIQNYVLGLSNVSDRRKNEVFRKRTADQIVIDGYSTGCTDDVLLFIALARAKGIPAKYVETIDKEWLKNGNDDVINGHQFAQIYDEQRDRWIWVNVSDNKFDDVPPEKQGKVVYREGLDSWDIGINDMNTLVAAFKEFQKKWQKEIK